MEVLQHFSDFNDLGSELREYRGSGDVKTRTRFESRLRAGRFVTGVVLGQNTDGTPRLKRQQAPMMSKAPQLKDRQYIMVYTSDDALYRPDGVPVEVLSFQEIYEDVVISDKNIEGIVINPTREKLLVSRDEMSRLMDQAVAAGQPHMKAKEAARMTWVANAWPREFEAALAETLRQMPNVREAYINETHIYWRPDERVYSVIIDFDGDDADVLPQVEAALKPHMTEKEKLRIYRANDNLLKNQRSTAYPVYAREDVRAALEGIHRELSRGFNSPGQTLFDDWKNELRAYIDNPGDKDLREAFEKKLYGSGLLTVLVQPINTMLGERPIDQDVVDTEEHGRLLAAFTDIRELRLHVSANTGFAGVPFSMLRNSVKDKDHPINGLVINPEGERLVLLAEELDRMDGHAKPETPESPPPRGGNRAQRRRRR
jgi:hypothetical protein